MNCRTTLVLDDQLMKELKRIAVDEHRTLSDVTAEMLRQGLRGRARARARGRITTPRLPSFSMGEPRVDLADRDRLLDHLDGR